MKLYKHFQNFPMYLGCKSDFPLPGEDSLNVCSFCIQQNLILYPYRLWILGQNMYNIVCLKTGWFDLTGKRCRRLLQMFPNSLKSLTLSSKKGKIIILHTLCASRRSDVCYQTQSCLSPSCHRGHHLLSSQLCNPEEKNIYFCYVYAFRMINMHIYKPQLQHQN